MGKGKFTLALTRCVRQPTAEAAEDLQSQIRRWLDTATVEACNAKVVIVPHAGYKYSAFTAAHSYKALAQSKQWRRVIVLGPSHRAILPSACVKCPFDVIATPLGPMHVGTLSGPMHTGSPSIDQNEHSLEMQFPFIKFCFPNAHVIPILVGDLGHDREKYAHILAEELLDKDTALVISSDFCHWGNNYSYAPSLGASGTMSGRIQALDMKGMDSIFTGDFRLFGKYLQQTRNTICGRNPIMLGLQIIEQAQIKGEWKLQHYSQSAHIQSYDPNQYSVSYLSAAFCVS
ncbi:hypothetical protein PSACC_02361 [Paramicrosporidium saccamoebae]|uniref:Uncharacterized protein n=1 Tax=Paramicrosporidium saccamoebae TaxID=1246581 RepID=A0A2H9TJA1_9FUNG|nr:hypothetical protein PSACC_02361 [Paramicrosporidium saccamoebae]